MNLGPSNLRAKTSSRPNLDILWSQNSKKKPSRSQETPQPLHSWSSKNLGSSANVPWSPLSAATFPWSNGFPYPSGWYEGQKKNIYIYVMVVWRWCFCFWQIIVGKIEDPETPLPIIQPILCYPRGKILHISSINPSLGRSVVVVVFKCVFKHTSKTCILYKSGVHIVSTFWQTKLATEKIHPSYPLIDDGCSAMFDCQLAANLFYNYIIYIWY